MAGDGDVERVFDLKKILAIIRKNWMVLRADRTRLVMMFFFPLVMILLFGYTSGQTPKHIPAAIVDYDNSLTSHTVISELNGNQLFSITRMVGTQDEGKKLIESGDIKILFVIPRGFGDDIAGGRTATLSVIVDESDPTVAQITIASTQAFIQQLSSQIAAKRIASLALAAGGLRDSLSAQRQAIASMPAPDGEESMKVISSRYIDAAHIAAQTARTSSAATEALGNTLGNIWDPNELVWEYENNVTTRAAFYDIMTASDAQQPTLQQMALYGGMAGTAGRMASDAAAMYAASKSLFADAAAAAEVKSVSLDVLDSATMRASEIASAAGSISPSSIAFNQIEPYGFGRPGLDFLIPSMLALIVFQGASMGMGRAIAGERQDGSLTRVFLTPTSNTTIIAGTLAFYMIFETIRSSLIVFAAVFLFGVTINGSLLDIFIVITIYAAGATGIGMVLSVLTRSQEQYQATAAIITLPSMFLAGVFLPIETMPPALQGLTKVLPITYASDALRGIMIKGFALGMVAPDVIFLALFAMFTLALSVMLFKREMI
jgi:ABC transporter DrrB family efflux protein